MAHTRCIRDTHNCNSSWVFRSTALGSALLAGSAIRLFGWDISKPETLSEVNTRGNKTFNPNMTVAEREKRWQGWQKAVERSRGWEEGVDSED